MPATRLLRVTIDDKQLKESMKKHAQNVAVATQAAAQETADVIQTRGREDISSAGNFGPSWTFGFKSAATETAGGAEVITTMSGRRHGWKVFQAGKTIAGRPLLWIPLTGTDAKGIPAKKYGSPLVQTTSRAGLPLLISKGDHRPKYFGKTSVTIPKKFHLIEIATEEGSKLAERFSEHFKRATDHG